MSRFAGLVAVFVAGAALSACSAKAPMMTPGDFYRTYAVPSGATAEEAVYTLPGLRIADLRSGTERDALIDVVEAVAAECPSLAESLFYIDCSEDPCGVFLAEYAGDNAEVWSAVTCDDQRLADFSTVIFLRGDDSHGLTWVVGSPEGTDVVAATARFNATWSSDALQLEMARQLGLAVR